MSDVNRYMAYGYRWARIAEDGDLVRYDDYAALRARLAAVEAALVLHQNLDAISVDAVNDLTARAERAEARLAEVEKERDAADELLNATWADVASNNTRLAETAYRAERAEAALDAANEGLTAAYLAGVADEKARSAERQ